MNTTECGQLFQFLRDRYDFIKHYHRKDSSIVFYNGQGWSSWLIKFVSTDKVLVVDINSKNPKLERTRPNTKKEINVEFSKENAIKMFMEIYE